MRTGSAALGEQAEKSLCFGKKNIAVTPCKGGGFWIPFKSAHRSLCLQLFRESQH